MIIFDTDYDNYAGIYDCQAITFFVHRQSAAILSRKPTLDPAMRSQVSVIRSYQSILAYFMTLIIRQNFGIAIGILESVHRNRSRNRSISLEGRCYSNNYN